MAALTTMGLAAMLMFTSAGFAAAQGAAVPPTPKSGPVAGGTTVAGAVPGVAPFVQVTGTMMTKWALTAGGVIWAWGDNRSSGFANTYGTGTAEGASWPPAVLTQDASGNPLPPFKLIGQNGSSAIDTAGNIWLWGICPDVVYDAVTDTYSCSSAMAYPTKLTSGIDRSGATVTLPQFTQITSADGAYIALDVNGNVWTWGNNSYGQLGIGAAPPTDPSVPIERAAIGPGIQSITWDAEGTALALDKNGNIWYWGQDQISEVTYGPTMLTGTGTTFKYVAGGYGGPSAIDTSGNIWLLYGGPEMESSGMNPVKMTATDSSGAPVSFVSTTGNQDVVVGLDSAGNLWVVGNNNGGSLGLGIPEPDTSGTTPGCTYAGVGEVCAIVDLTEITKDMSGNPMPTFTAIGTQTADQDTTAIAADGSIWYWGWDNNGYAWWDETVTSGMGSYWIAPAPLLSLQPVVTGVTFGGVAGTNLTLTTAPVSGKYANYQTSADNGAYTVVDPSGACGPVDVVVSYDLRLTWAIPKDINTVEFTEDPGPPPYIVTSDNVVGVSYQTADTTQTPLTYPKGFTYTGATCSAPPRIIHSDTGGSLVAPPWLAIISAGLMITAGLVLSVRRVSASAHAG